jgi:hypothetical protein
MEILIGIIIGPLVWLFIIGCLCAAEPTKADDNKKRYKTYIKLTSDSSVVMHKDFDDAAKAVETIRSLSEEKLINVQKSIEDIRQAKNSLLNPPTVETTINQDFFVSQSVYSDVDTKSKIVFIITFLIVLTIILMMNL